MTEVVVVVFKFVLQLVWMLYIELSIDICNYIRFYFRVALTGYRD